MTATLPLQRSFKPVRPHPRRAAAQRNCACSAKHPFSKGRRESRVLGERDLESPEKGRWCDDQVPKGGDVTRSGSTCVSRCVGVGGA